MVNFEYTNTSAVDCSIEPDLTKLRRKSVIITGGSTGIGAAHIRAFLHAGAFVTNTDLQPSKEHKDDSNYQHVKCDVTSWEQLVAAFKAAIANSPEKSLDVVVANAGITSSDSIYKLDDTDEPKKPDLKIIDVNLIGTMYTAKLAMHYFNKQDASRDRSLILTSSLAGYIDLPGATQYQVSKFGVRGLLCNLRRANRMRVNAIAPWYVHTPLMPDAMYKAIDETLARMGSSWATVDDAAKACLRCAVDDQVNGRMFAITPRTFDENGYRDLSYDDYENRAEVQEWQKIPLAVTDSIHRSAN